MAGTEWNFVRGEDGKIDLEGAVFQALGGASACWDNLEGAGVFQSERARAIGDKLTDYLKSSGPWLGYVTTHELIRELAARAEVSSTIGEPLHLDYRTVDS